MKIRRRIRLLICLAVTIVLGLASRMEEIGLPQFLTTNAGDALWTMAVYWSLAGIWPRASRWRIAWSAGLISLGVEISQLIDVRWLNEIRQTLPGRLLLGRGFDSADLVRYAIGAVLASWIDGLALANGATHREVKSPAPPENEA